MALYALSEFDKVRKAYVLDLLDLEIIKRSLEYVINQCLDQSTTTQNNLIETFNKLQAEGTAYALQECDKIQEQLQYEEEFQDMVQSINDCEKIFKVYDDYMEKVKK